MEHICLGVWYKAQYYDLVHVILNKSRVAGNRFDVDAVCHSHCKMVKTEPTKADLNSDLLQVCLTLVDAIQMGLSHSNHMPLLSEFKQDFWSVGKRT